MRVCLDETHRRRQIQIAYNEKHGITPQSIIKSIPEDLRKIYGITSDSDLLETAALNEALAIA